MPAKLPSRCFTIVRIYFLAHSKLTMRDAIGKMFKALTANRFTEAICLAGFIPKRSVLEQRATVDVVMKTVDAIHRAEA